MASIRFKRGTRAQIEAAAASAWLSEGEPYLVTDEQTVAIGLSSTEVVDLARADSNPFTVFALDVPAFSGSTSVAVAGLQPWMLSWVAPADAASATAWAAGNLFFAADPAGNALDVTGELDSTISVILTVLGEGEL